MKFLNGTKHKKLRLRMDNIKCIKWYINAAFAVHADYKSHTGATMTFGEGAVQSISQKEKLNTRSSTKAELVAADDAAVIILWTKLFLEEQGYTVEKNIYTRIIRAPFCWKRMDGRVREKGLGH